MVTVVDAANLLKDYSSQDFLRDRGETAGDSDRRALVDLLVEQIEFADVVVLNKIGDARPGERNMAQRIVRSLNPDAQIIETDFGRAPLEKILDTGRFDFEKAQEHPLWYKELNGFRDHVPETEEYGITSFVYRERRPFDPLKLQGFINRSWPGVVRAKGFFWLATRPHHVGELSQAGALVRTSKRGLWWASVPKDQWPRPSGMACCHEALSRSRLGRPSAGNRLHRLPSHERSAHPRRARRLPRARDRFRAAALARHARPVPELGAGGVNPL
jgi:G3E family GTPase